MGGCSRSIIIGFRLNLALKAVPSLWGEKGMEFSNSVGVDPLEILNFTVQSRDQECSDPPSTMYTALFANSRTQTPITSSMGCGLDFSVTVICTLVCTEEGRVSHPL